MEMPARAPGVGAEGSRGRPLVQTLGAGASGRRHVPLARLGKAPGAVRWPSEAHGVGVGPRRGAREAGRGPWRARRPARSGGSPQSVAEVCGAVHRGSQPAERRAQERIWASVRFF
jgi:hypothetical protein